MEETKHCPYCGEEILAVAKKCKHCGEWIKEDISCPICGEHIPANATVCPVCEEPVSQSVDQPTKQPSMKMQGDITEFKETDKDEDEEYISKGFFSFYGIRVWKKYCFKSSDCVSRGEYWKFILTTCLTTYFVIACLSFVTTVITVFLLRDNSQILSSLYAILILAIIIFTSINSICMSIRRLHDTGRGGWWLFISCFPLIDLIVLAFLCRKGISVDPKAKAKSKDVILLIAMLLIGTMMYVGTSALAFSTESSIETAPNTIVNNESEDESNVIEGTDEELEPISELLQFAEWEKHDGGFQVPTFMIHSEESFYGGECWTYGNVSLVYWDYLASWATYEFPEEDRNLMEDVLVYDITYQNSSSTIFSGHTSDGRIWYMKKRIHNGGDVPCASALVVIYPEELKSDINTFINIIKNW